MRTLVHLSDLHFGNHNPGLLDALRDAVNALHPDLLIVSGDFVEHATVAEFEQAREYIDSLPGPQLVIAGNHDLPFYDPVRRYRERLLHYSRHIASDLEPIVRDPQMIVMGINTPRVIPIKGGRINQRQIKRVQQAMCGAPPDVARVLVTHHPLDLPGRYRKSALAGRARLAVETLSQCCDLMIAGHLHLSSTGATAARYQRSGHSTIFAQAGTAISLRNKGEPNSFNVIRLEPGHIQIEHRTWHDSNRQYEPRAAENFVNVRLAAGQREWKLCE